MIETVAPAASTETRADRRAIPRSGVARPAARTPVTRSPVRRGVAGAVLVLVCLGGVRLLATPPFLPDDESYHAAYALDVVDGRLPVLRERLVPRLPGQQATAYYGANHPPLYYAMTGPVLRAGIESGHALAGIRLARALTVAMSAGTVVVVALLAGVVARRRRAEVMILAAGLTATVPAFVNTSSLIHNDALAVLGSSVALLGAALAVKDGVRTVPVALVCSGSAVALATRFSSVGVVLVAAAGLALACIIHRVDLTQLRRLVHGVAFGALPFLCVAATSGWFYLRNRRLYGDFTAVSFKTEEGGPDTTSLWGYLSSPRNLVDLVIRNEGGGGFRPSPNFDGWNLALLTAAGGVVALGGALFLGRLRRWRASSRGRNGRWGFRLNGASSSRAGLAAAGLIAGVVLVSWVQLAGYADQAASQAGGAYPRYSLGAIPAVAIILACACLGYRGRLGAVVGVGLIGVQAILAVVSLGNSLDLRLNGSLDRSPLGVLRDAFVDAGIGAPTVVLGVLSLGVLVGLALQLSALLTVQRSSSETARVGDGETAGRSPEPASLISLSRRVMADRQLLR